jgi:hypothetical protein
VGKCNHCEVIRDFRSLKNGAITFPFDGSIADQKCRNQLIRMTATSPQVSVHVSLYNSDRFEVIHDFRSLTHGEIPFPVRESIGQRK